MLQVNHASEPIEVGVSHPAELSGEPGLWRVVTGHVDLFAVAEADCRQIGNRYFIQSAEPGTLLLASPPTGNDPQCRLYVHATDTASVERFDPQARVSAAPIDGWINRIAAAVARAHGHRQGGQVLMPGDLTCFRADTELRAGRDVIWAEIKRGSVLLFGDTAHRFLPGSVVPLTGSGWVLVDADDTEVQALTTAEILVRSGWLDWLVTWQKALLALLAGSLRTIDLNESERVSRSKQWSHQVKEATLERFADALTLGVTQKPGAAAEPLVAVCRAVAEAMGFTIPEQPPRTSQQTAGMTERIARYSRMPVREVTLRGRWWRDQLGPLIVFRRDNSAPVALLPGRRGRYDYYDPSAELLLPLTAERAEQLGSSAYILYPPLPQRSLRMRDLLSISLKEGQRDLALMLVMGAISSMLGLVVPVATGILIDQFIPSHLEWALWELGILLLLIVVVMVILHITQDLAQVRILGRSANRLQPAIVDRTVRLASGFLKQFTSADLAERVSIIDAIRNGLSVIVIDAMLAGIFSLVSILLLLVYSPLLAVLAVLLTFPLLFAAVWASRSQLPALAVAEARTAEASQLVFQLVDNISHLRAAGAEERAFARWGALHRSMQAALLSASRSATRLNAFTTGYGTIGLAGFFLALERLKPTAVTVGDMVMLVSVYGSFLGASTSFCLGLQRILLLQPKLARAKVLLAAESESDPTRVDPGELSGRIEVSHLSFGYVDAAPPILQDISFAIEPGQFVAIVGPSGCGKTTLLRLLLGFEPPRGGSILYDDHDLKRLDVRAVRRQIGTVLQTDRLIPGSILENILGVSLRTNEEAWDAARWAGLADDISEMPMGMHTLLIDGATTLSGGQAQRLLIARALVGNPRIILFDEATSALDNHSQAIVMQSLERMAVTRLVIAHRVSTIRRADVIFVLDGGRIVQSGNYDELAARPGLLADLIRQQEI